MDSPPENKKPWMAGFVVHATRGVIRDQKGRRNMMFVSLLIALLLLFCGSTFLYPLLRPHPLWFVLYWCACAWLTTLAVLLALFDLLMTRAEARAAEKMLRSQFVDSPTQDSQSDVPRK
jgi:hypothetical protein